MPLPALAIPAIVKRVPAWAWIGLGAVLLLAAFYLALDAYGDARYDAGKDQADKEWKAAGDRLIAKAHNSAAAADKKEAARLADHAAKVEDEKEKIDAALADGSSPFDVLFGAE